MLNQSYAYCSPNLHIPATFGYAQMIVFDVFGFLDHVYYFSFMCIQICSLCFVCCFCSCIKDPVGTNTHRCAAYESMYLPCIYVDIAHSCLASLLVHHPWFNGPNKDCHPYAACLVTYGLFVFFCWSKPWAIMMCTLDAMRSTEPL